MDSLPVPYVIVMFIVAVGVTLPGAESALDESMGVGVSSAIEVLITNPVEAVFVGSAVLVLPVLPGLDVEVLIEMAGLDVSVAVFVTV